MKRLYLLILLIVFSSEAFGIPGTLPIEGGGGLYSWGSLEGNFYQYVLRGDKENVRDYMRYGIALRVYPNKRLNGIGLTPLDIAIKIGNPEMVQLILDLGAKPNHPNHHIPLIRAIQVEQAEIVEILLQAGADVYGVDHYGMTALQWARERNNRAIIDLVEQNKCRSSFYRSFILNLGKKIS
ncbi:MAG: ankyrin repeat domain-containing protein [Oligoflexia bacterium]|nr:ankyrin repeat domain-containing protein [Oligoflexia bacterium]